MVGRECVCAPMRDVLKSIEHRLRLIKKAKRSDSDDDATDEEDLTM